MIDEKVLIERLEEKAFSVQIKQGVKEPSTHDAMMEKFSVLEIKEIVKDLTSEHNNGWIPCSERLPEISNSYLVTKMCENDGNPIYETAHEIFWTNDKKWDCERDEYCEWKVTAWQNKLSPYKKGE